MAATGLSEAARRYYILAPEIAIPEDTHVLKHDQTFALFNDFGDIDSRARHDEGLYRDGTRFLSHLALTLYGERPLLLSSNVRRDNLLMSADLTNPDVYTEGRVIVPRGSLHIFRAKLLWKDTCYERIHVRNFGNEPLEIVLALTFAADYADIFEIRGERRPRRGSMQTPRVDAGSVELAYEGLDGLTRRTRLECRPMPARATASSMEFELLLESRTEQVLTFTIGCSAGTGTLATFPYEQALRDAERERASGGRFVCGIETSNDQFNAWLQRSAADLDMLLTHTPFGLYPYAGVPWFDTTFGRDGIITALECLWLSPDMARGVLSFLAATQATQLDPVNDAEPGKILHEARGGEMAALGEVPFGRYYGSIDSTPLFVMLAGEYFVRTGDRAFIESIWPNVRAALEWIERYGDRDGDGFLEYQRRSPSGLVQQGWKDSHDSVFHADGSLADGPIALCEVQGYAYAARIAAARLALALHDEDLAEDLVRAARRLRERFLQAFWCEDLGLYALALDGRKVPCRVRSSNAGHCVFTGIASEAHARSIVRTLCSDTFFSGWGVRTIADCEARYNAMAYHNGSIWPHDNALIAAGSAQMRSKELALRILRAQFEASTFFESNRLPELFCGFRRREGKAPTSYPVACSPQAWAAGAPFMILRACLGLEIDAPAERVLFRYPRLPAGVNEVHLKGLTVGDAAIDLRLHRYADGVGVSVERGAGAIDVVVLG